MIYLRFGNRSDWFQSFFSFFLYYPTSERLHDKVLDEVLESHSTWLNDNNRRQLPHWYIIRDMLHQMVCREGNKGEVRLILETFLFFWLFRAVPEAYGGSQARGPMGAIAASLHHSHSHARSELLCKLHSSWQRQILSPLSRARDRTLVLMESSQVC